MWLQQDGATSDLQQVTGNTGWRITNTDRGSFMDCGGSRLEQLY